MTHHITVFLVVLASVHHSHRLVVAPGNVVIGWRLGLRLRRVRFFLFVTRSISNRSSYFSRLLLKQCSNGLSVHVGILRLTCQKIQPVTVCLHFLAHFCMAFKDITAKFEAFGKDYFFPKLKVYPDCIL
jgi:hypothetical protein